VIAALYVETGGAYFGQPWEIDPWDEKRDARLYAGPHPIVAHPPCQRWGRFAEGGTHPNSPRFEVGADDGCFAAALAAVRRWGGVIEHPKDSKAWAHFKLSKPPHTGGWVPAGDAGGWTCCVYQGHYGHFSGKGTWLYVNGVMPWKLPDLRWGACEQRIHPVALAKHGYKKARRIGMVAMVGGKDKTRIREATPPEFRDLLIQIARSVTSPPTPPDRRT